MFVSFRLLVVESVLFALLDKYRLMEGVAHALYADRELVSKRAASAGFGSPGRTFGYLLFYAVFYVGSPVAVLYL